MPTKVFDALDITSDIHTDVGHLNYITYVAGIVQNNVNMVDLVDIPAPLSFDVLFNFNSTGQTVVGVQGSSRHQWVGGIHTDTVIMNYIQPITGLPDGARISKMVIRSPWHCNIDMSIVKSAGFFTAAMTKKMQVRREIEIGSFLDTRQFGQVTTTTQALTLIDEEINADADVIVFDIANQENYLSLAQFITQYKTIILRLKQEGVTDLDTFQTLGVATPNGTTITNSCIYLVSFHTGWTITVTYVEGVTWELSNPPSNRAVGPGDSITITPKGVNPLDPRQILTLEIALLDKDGNEVGIRVAIPQLLWTVVQSNLFTFLLPNFSQSVNIQHIKIFMTSTQFVGSVLLQQMWAIYFYNAPGVYTLIDGRTHDTYYDRDEVDITTVDTKIPNPTGRTGYY